MSPRRAVIIGTCVVNLPVLAIIALGFLASSRLLQGWFVLAGCLLSIATAWFFWSLAIPYWREWALKSGADPDMTQMLAERAGLVWKRGKVLEKTEVPLSDRSDHR
jgi:uncharacterized membrane protein